MYLKLPTGIRNLKIEAEVALVRTSAGLKIKIVSSKKDSQVL
jgi:hypothetical protein